MARYERQRARQGRNGRQPEEPVLAAAQQMGIERKRSQDASRFRHGARDLPKVNIESRKVCEGAKAVEVCLKQEPHAEPEIFALTPVLPGKP
jgi:hypothetical protein